MFGFHSPARHGSREHCLVAARRVAAVLSFGLILPAGIAAQNASYAALTITAGAGSGAGHVGTDPALSGCLVEPGKASGLCAPRFAVGTTIVLTATPDPAAYMTFEGWTGDCAGTSPSCTLVMDAARTVGARFASHIDLAPVSIEGPASLAPGATRVPVRLEVANQGDMAAPPGIVARVIVVTGNDAPRPVAEVRTPALDPGEHWSTLAAMDIPSGLSAPLKWNLSLVVDPEDSVHELREDNNTLLSEAIPAIVGYQVGVGYGGPVYPVPPDGSGTLVSTPAGISCRMIGLSEPGPDCSSAFPSGTVVTFTPRPDRGDMGGEFVGPSECNLSLTCTLTVGSPVTFEYGFWRFIPGQQMSISVVNGHVQSNMGIVIDCPPSSNVYPGGSPSYGSCTFSLTSTPITITFTGSGLLDSAQTNIRHCAIVRSFSSFYCDWRPSIAFPASRIVFSKPGLVVAAARDNAGVGDVTWNPVDSAAVCTITPGAVDAAGCGPRTVGPWQLTALRANPRPGYAFVRWGGRCSGSTPECTVKLYPDTVVAVARVDTDTVYVTFVRKGRVTVATAGAGSGRVFSTPAGIGCAANGNAANTGDCSALFDLQSKVTLSAIPAPGSVFSGWSGASCGAAGDCTIVPDTVEARVTATFVPAAVLTLASSGDGSGSVRSEPAGLSCSFSTGASSPCTGTFAKGTAMVLTAVPAAGAAFTGWSGACAGTASCTLTLDADSVVVSASFAGARALTLNATGAGRGTITTQGDMTPAIACVVADGKSSGRCTASYTAGTVVRLTASPAANSVFAGWTDGCTGAGACEVTIPAGTTAPVVGARFDWLPVPIDAAVDAVLGGAPLPTGQAESLDLQGNRNGIVDLGDVLALMRRTGVPASQAAERLRRAKRSRAP